MTLRAIELPPHVAVDSLGPGFPSLDRACRTLAFAAAGDVYVHRLDGDEFELASRTARDAPGGRPSGLPALSADASRVAFDSAAPLVPGVASPHDQIYVRDLRARETLLASVSPIGEPADAANLGLDTGLAISADGAHVAFSSYATNLVPDDRNGAVDVFVRALGPGVTERASSSSEGAEAHGDSGFPSLSGDGRLVAFSSAAEDLVPGDANGLRDVFVRDRSAGTTELISAASGSRAGDGASDLPRISADGRFVAFASDATNLVPDDTNGARDVFLFDRELGRLARLSGAASSSEGPSDQPHVSDDGSRVAFLSRLADPKGDGTPRQQLVLHDVPTGQRWVVSSAADGQLGDDDSGDWGLALSGDGRCVAFASLASNLGGGRAPALYVARVPTLRRADPGDRGGAKSGL